VAAFGREIVAPDGSIDHAVLGRRVFGDAAALGRLNALLHPAAQGAIEAWVVARREEACLGISQHSGSNEPRLHPFGVGAVRENGKVAEGLIHAQGWRGGVVAIIPLLYETAWEAAWDRVICVGAPIALQRKRLRSKGFTEKEAHDRMAAQWPVEEKMKRADYVIFNAGTQVCAQRQTVQVMQHIGIHMEKSDGR
jgi:dephospho-CoA kinase